MTDSFTLFLNSISVILIGVSTYTLVRYRHKEYEISLYEKQIDAGDKLINECSDYLNKFFKKVQEYYDETNVSIKVIDGKFNDIQLEHLHRNIANDFAKDYQDSFYKMLRFSSLLPDRIADEALHFYEDTFEMFNDSPPLSFDELYEEGYECFGNLVDAIRIELHVESLSKQTRSKIPFAAKRKFKN